MKKKVVIVGFPGIGMTELSKRHNEYVETNVSTNGGSITALLELLDEGFKVLIPFSKEACNLLNEAKIRFVIVYPARDLKDVICQRVVPRDEEYTRITDLMNTWDEQIDQAMVQECYTRVMLTMENTYLSDLIVYIENLFTTRN